MPRTQYQSTLLLPTLRDDPASAETVSHKWMLRAGLIRKLAAGIYNILPAGLRSLRKIERIIRDEMNAAGAQELLMPSVIPAELWQDSGRWEKYGPELLRLKDRHNRDFVFGPTHEEVITDIVRNNITSYKQLPLNLYQIQAKFRDEIRPRFGVMRGREFLMKDAYSFHANTESLATTYDRMAQAYHNIFRKTGLDFVVVDADAGTIGGSRSQEFMVLADSGEDALVRCPDCGYAANLEKASFRPTVPLFLEQPERAEVATPNQRSIEEVSTFLGVPPDRMFKTMVYNTERGPVMVVLAGHRQVQETKLRSALQVAWTELPEAEEVLALAKGPAGFLGPINGNLPLYVDRSATTIDWGVTGANKLDTHITGVVLADFPDYEVVDVAEAVHGDGCPGCEGTLVQKRGIEVGHIFKLGTRYSDAMQATVLDEKGQAIVLEMGCYGIGVTRSMAAAIEQHHDDKGICWPWPIAPWHIHLLLLDPVDDSAKRILGAVEPVTVERGWELLVDDRMERPGVKFNDADIIGCPLQLIAGNRGLSRGMVEYKIRATGERGEFPVEDLKHNIIKLVRSMLDKTR